GAGGKAGDARRGDRRCEGRPRPDLPPSQAHPPQPRRLVRLLHARGSPRGSFAPHTLPAPRAVRRLHLAGDAIVAICPPLTTGFSAWLAGRRGRTPYVLLIHDLDPADASGARS